MTDADVFDRHRGLLFSIAYRMLGSVADAEDMVQEAYVRWQQADRQPVETPRAWLSAVVTRLCLDQIKCARVQRATPLPAALPEPLAGGDPFAAAAMADSLSIAFLVVLQTLRPTERAIFLLHEVFEFDHAAIAAVVGKSEPACRQILRRAKAQIAARRPRVAVPRAELERITEQFVSAVRAGDANALLTLLHEDVTFNASGATRYGRARAIRRPLRGAATVARLLLAVQQQAPPALQYRIAEVNGGPAVLAYEAGRVLSVLSLDVVAGRVRGIYVLADPVKLESLGPLRTWH
jgi:RNA polymerase sigma-70 factor (ECF subfamily)